MSNPVQDISDAIDRINAFVPACHKGLKPLKILVEEDLPARKITTVYANCKHFMIVGEKTYNTLRSMK